MDVSVIIVNYNTREILGECLRSVRERTEGLEYEVIVVDNASVDGSQEYIRRAFPWVRLIESKKNLGFGKANNLGMKEARGKYLFLLNSDTILKNNALKIFYEYSEQYGNASNILTNKKDRGIGALGAILLGPDGRNCHSYGRFITPARELKEVVAKYLKFLKDKDKFNPSSVSAPKEVDYITGADLWVPREVFERTGGFDPAFFMYCEEVDWQKRMDDIGLKRVIIPGPEIVHLEGGSDRSKKKVWSPSRLKNIYTSKRIYYKKHFNRLTYPFFRLLFLILNTPVIMLNAIKNRGDYKKLIKYQ